MAADEPDAGAAKPRGSELALRVASAVALAPLAIGAAYLGGWWFTLFWLIAALGVMWEWATLVGPSSSTRLTGIGAVALVAGTFALTSGYGWLALAAVIVGAAAAAASATEGRQWVAAGVVYAAALVLAPVLLRTDPVYGFAAILLLLAVVWSTDIAGYFGGRLIGGPKLWPRVSPKKTWSGAGVGTAVAVAAGMGVGWTAGARNLVALGAVCLVLSAASQAGDLFESALKRRFGAKDSSQIIPGHGGLMDRLDGFLAAALVGAVVGLARGGLEAPSRGLMIW